MLTRLFVDPVDYLEAYLTKDNILGHRVNPESSGHDAWGFRNLSVPSSARIVAIGDSQTYGISASARNSWPAKLETLRNETVYNLSLGGYGPIQYYHLLSKKGLSLRPSTVIVGFYFGNDLFDAYQLVYTNDYWMNLRNPDLAWQETTSASSGTRRHHRRFLGSLRNWLARHSIVYRMFSFSFGNIYRFLELKYLSSDSKADLIVVEDKKGSIRTGLTPLSRLSALDLGDITILEGLRLTLAMFQRMNDLCVKENIDFVVVLIPTKESVFAEYVGKNGKDKELSQFYEVIRNERQINQLIKRYLHSNRIPYLDVLPALSATLGKKTVYPASHDGHPSADGYQVMAEAIQKRLVDLHQGRESAAISLN